MVRASRDTERMCNGLTVLKTCLCAIVVVTPLGACAGVPAFQVAGHGPLPRGMRWRACVGGPWAPAQCPSPRPSGARPPYLCFLIFVMYKENSHLSAGCLDEFHTVKPMVEVATSGYPFWWSMESGGRYTVYNSPLRSNHSR